MLTNNIAESSEIFTLGSEKELLVPIVGGATLYLWVENYCYVFPKHSRTKLSKPNYCAMKNYLLLVLTSIVIFFNACEKKDECYCRSLEECVDGQCVLQENCYYLNNVGIKGRNLYHGVVKGNGCIDTLVLDVNLSEPSPFNQFALFVDHPLGGAWDVGPFVYSKISENEYRFGTGGPLCYLGLGWHGDIRCLLAKDSVMLNIRFTSFGTPVDYIDSCEVTLYK